MEYKINITFIGNISATFVRRDYELLKKHFNITFVQDPQKKREWLKLLLILMRETKKCDITISWLVWWHSAIPVFFSKLFHKKSIVIVGGHGAANLPEFKYGVFRNLKGRIPAIYIYRNVDEVLIVDKSLKKDILI